MQKLNREQVFGRTRNKTNGTTTVQGILEQESTIIRKLLARDLIVNAPSNTVVELNTAMEALNSDILIIHLMNKKLRN